LLRSCCESILAPYIRVVWLIEESICGAAAGAFQEAFVSIGDELKVLSLGGEFWTSAEVERSLGDCCCDIDSERDCVWIVALWSSSSDRVEVDPWKVRMVASVQLFS